MSLRRGLGLALIASLAVTGCGGSSGSSKSSAPPSKAAAASAGAAINLAASDLPSGYKGAPHDDSADTKAQTAAFIACTGASNVESDTIADLNSPDFSKGAQLNMKQVSSDVQIVKSASQARSDLRAYNGDKTKGCLSTFITKLLTKAAGGATFSAPTITKLTPHADGIEGAFGYQVNLSASAAGLTIPFEIAIEGLLVKHSEVSLTVLSIGGPFPTADRDALFAKLAARSVKSAV